MIYRRQRQQYLFAGVLAVIAVVNILFFFVLNRPARVEHARLEESIRQLRAQAGANKVFLDRLAMTSTQLDRFDKDKNALLMKHLIHRDNDPAFADAVVATFDEIKRAWPESIARTS